LATTKFQVGNLETKLRASTQAFEEAQAQLSEFKPKQQQEIEATVKFSKQAVTHAKAQASKAEEMMSKKEADQATREEQVRLALEKLSNFFGGKCH
jgi:hypothetical protein